ncbi:MAG: hypothetical protein FJ265_03610 [Planctomycetes bacterium]|nr:hypothetical protein [Planctomycetota bacterium]
MPCRPHLLPLLATLGAIAAAVGWQYADLRGHQQRHLQAHRRYGEALLNAVDGIAAREFRGGTYSVDAVAAAMTDSRERFGLQWLAIETDTGEQVTSAGTKPAPVPPDSRFEKRFVPMRPLGRGPRWPPAEQRTLPDRPLYLCIVLDDGDLAARLQGDLRRMVVTSLALGLAIVLVAGLVWLRTHGLALRAELAAQRARLDGLETMRRLGAGLVHETKNPLGVVRGFAERLLRSPLDAAQLQQTAQAIVEETDRTVARLDEFLLLSRPAALRRTEVPVRALFEELATLLRPDFENVGARLVLCAGDEVIQADRDQIRRLFLNLLLNAVQAVERGGTVELACEARGRGLALTVADDGCGVPEALRTTLFEPYVSGRPGGTGLGLAIARRIASDHGFLLTCAPRQGRGTCMTLEVPG